MKRLVIGAYLTLFTLSTLAQSSLINGNPSYRYYSNPGFINITEINGAKGLGSTDVINSKYYFGVTSIFGYQINRNFMGGIGVGYYIYDSEQLMPIFLEFRYSRYLKNLTPFVFADGGSLLDLEKIIDGTKIFINPGIGISRYLSSKLEGTFAVGLTVQMGDNLPRTSFLNFRLGIIYRKNSYRLFKPRKEMKYH
jgi:hypothetical protein